MYTNPNPTVDDDDIDISSQENKIIDFPGEPSQYDIDNDKTVYFVFIDILGFKELFSNPNKSEQKEFTQSCGEIFNYYFQLINPIVSDKSNKSYAGQTSDSLYFYTENIEILTDYIRIFSNFSLYSMTKNVFFRGGIAKGSLYKNEDYQFYGQSVINAYMLESEIAKNPLIVIDEKTNNDLSEIGDEDFKNIYLRNLNNNSRKYINPFASLNFDDYIDPSLISSELNFRKINCNDIEQNIQAGKLNAEFSVGVYSKYECLLKLFNDEKNNKNKENNNG